MSKNVPILIVAPDDVIEEMNLAFDEIHKTDRELSFNNDIKISVQKYEHFRENISKVVSKDTLLRILHDIEIYVGIFWKRIGKYSLEEFSLAYDQWKSTGRPKILLFFKRAPFYPESIEETKQVYDLISFKKSISQDCIYTEFENLQDLSPKLHIALQQSIRDIASSAIFEIRQDPDKDSNKHYDVALSFSSNDRGYAEKLAKRLMSLDINVFYDAWDTNALWGRNLYEHLQGIYSSSTCCVLLISSSYKKESWSNFEMKAVAARSLVDNTYNILPILLDNSDMPTQLSTISYLDARRVGVDTIAFNIKEKYLLLKREIIMKRKSLKERFHVITRGNGWVIKKENQDNLIDTFKKKETAVSYARKLQKENNNIEVVIHKQDGTIEEMIDG